MLQTHDIHLCLSSTDIAQYMVYPGRLPGQALSVPKTDLSSLVLLQLPILSGLCRTFNGFEAQ